MISANAHNSFVAGAYCNFTESLCQSDGVYNVPQGQIAVIDSVSGVCAIQNGTALLNLAVSFTAPTGNTAAVVIPPGPLVPEDNFSISTVGQNITTYAVGNTPIGIGAATNTVQPNTSICNFVISGHLEPQ